MPFNASVEVTKTWTLLTASDVTAITIQNIHGDDVQIMGTAGAVAPADTQLVAGLVLEYGVAVINRAMTDMFPGVAATRVYARTNPGSPDSYAVLFVSHA